MIKSQQSKERINELIDYLSIKLARANIKYKQINSQVKQLINILPGWQREKLNPQRTKGHLNYLKERIEFIEQIYDKLKKLQEIKLYFRYVKRKKLESILIKTNLDTKSKINDFFARIDRHFNLIEERININQYSNIENFENNWILENSLIQKNKKLLTL